MAEHPGVVNQGRPLSFQGRRQHQAEMSLLNPDDTLSSHENLAAIAMWSSQPAAPCNITKLVLPSESAMALDPLQLPETTYDENGHQTIYHVTTTAKDSQVIVIIIIDIVLE